MLRKLFAVPLFLVVVALLCLAQTPKTRHFIFNYSFSVKISDPGKPLDVWFPVAQSDKFQRVKVISQTGDMPLRETADPEYGNRMLYAHVDKANRSEYHFSVKYDVVRTEHLSSVAVREDANTRELNRFLQPDKLVPITGKPAELARQQIKPGMTDMEKARAFYDYTFNTLRYDKTGTGWGRGDTLWACDAKQGNCTDFHSVFISMARSQHIPARFEIGFSVPAEKTEADIAGYHCWAEFYTKERGWFPVDISEAWKNREKKDYFFGAHDVNRMQFTVGRDLELNPKQHGDRLNYFVYPYAELDHQAYPNVAITFSSTDVKYGEKAAASASR